MYCLKVSITSIKYVSFEIPKNMAITHTTSEINNPYSDLIDLKYTAISADITVKIASPKKLTASPPYNINRF